jgi:hypothetical protein
LRVCTSCKEEKTNSEFPPNKNYKDGINRQCRDCVNAKQRIYRSREDVKARAKKRYSSTTRVRYHLKYKYGITEEEYDQMYLNQGGCCMICEKYFDILHVDHCHSTDIVRGLLCGNCNRALGIMHEDVDAISRMINYLEEHHYEKTI